MLIQARVERRIAFAPDGTLFVTGADAFRFYDSDLDSIEGRDFTDNPDMRRNFTGRVHPDQLGRHDPEGQPVARPRDRRARDFRARFQGSRRRGDQSRRPASSGSRTTGRRAATRSTSSAPATTTAGPTCRTACSTTRVSPTAARTCRSAAARRRARRRRADLLLGAVDRAVGHGVLHRQPVSRVEGQPLRRRDGRQAARATRAERRERRRRGAAADRARRSASAKCARGPTARCTCSRATHS